jgi:hypothetical protein
LINSEEIDRLCWPLWDTATRNNYVSKIILEVMKADGRCFIKAVNGGPNGVTFTENIEKMSQGRVLAKLKGKTKARAKAIDSFSPNVLCDDWAPPHITQSSFTGGSEEERQSIIDCMKYY